MSRVLARYQDPGNKERFLVIAGHHDPRTLVVPPGVLFTVQGQSAGPATTVTLSPRQILDALGRIQAWLSGHLDHLGDVDWDAMAIDARGVVVQAPFWRPRVTPHA